MPRTVIIPHLILVIPRAACREEQHTSSKNTFIKEAKKVLVFCLLIHTGNTKLLRGMKKHMY